MKITIVTGLFAKWDVDVDSGHSFSFQYQWAVSVGSVNFQLTDSVLILNRIYLGY
ncbi:hypothetical protein [Maribacter hydrothermalis]|uniref:hypothetical protein n=1 Tax=Maribacter hydrothermalis TaxID=1836467 RepID=UPI0018D29F4E|nr:hypothetical protein [Maribacter hydrothermalis]